MGEVSKTATHVLISGVVQGVGYRFSTQKAAIAHGLTGWVRNLPDGRVEAYFEGKPEAVAAMVHWCHQGPPAAKVHDVTVAYPGLEGYDAFQIRR